MTHTSSLAPLMDESLAVGNAQQHQVITLQLNKLPLLTCVDEAALRKMAGVLQVRTAARGQTIMHKAQTGEHLLFLLSERLQAVDITEDGRKIGLSFLQAGDYFGALSVIDGLPRSAIVVACEPSFYALLARSHALELMHNQSMIVRRMFQRLASGIRRFEFRNHSGYFQCFSASLCATRLPCKNKSWWIGSD